MPKTNYFEFILDHASVFQGTMQVAALCHDWFPRTITGGWIRAEELHWLLLARILSAQKQSADAETIVDAILDQTGRLIQGDLL